MTTLEKQMLMERAQLYITTSAGPYATPEQKALVGEIQAELVQVAPVTEAELGEAILEELRGLNP